MLGGELLKLVVTDARDEVGASAGRAEGAPPVAASAATSADVPRVLRAHLKERLPEYMIPSAFVVLPALPLTPNGKVDRKALPEPEREPSASLGPAGPGAGWAGPGAAARTPLQELLAGIWCDVLGVAEVGIGESGEASSNKFNGKAR